MHHIALGITLLNANGHAAKLFVTPQTPILDRNQLLRAHIMRNSL